MSQLSIGLLLVICALALTAVVSSLDTPRDNSINDGVGEKNKDFSPRLPEQKGSETTGIPATESTNLKDEVSPSREQISPRQPIAPSADEDEIVLSRLDLAKLSQTRADLARLSHPDALPIETKCSTYADLLQEMLGDRGSPDKKTLFGQVVRVLSRRKLPFGNSQPVLIDIQECLNEQPNEEESPEPKREVIASPPIQKRTDEPSAAEKGMDKAIGEFKDVRNNVKDFGQDIYLPDKNKPIKGSDELVNQNGKSDTKSSADVNHEHSDVDHSLDGEATNTSGHERDDNGKQISDELADRDDNGKQISDELADRDENLPSDENSNDDEELNGTYTTTHVPDHHGSGGAYAYSSVITNSDGNNEFSYDISTTDSQGRTTHKHRKELPDYHTNPPESGDEVSDQNRESIEAELDESYREIFDLRNRVAELELIADRAVAEAAQAKEALQNNGAQANPSVDRARAETYRHQYEAVAEREVNLLKLLNEYRAKLNDQERHAVDHSETTENDSDNDSDDEEDPDFKSTSTDPVKLAEKLAKKLDFNEEPNKRCARYYLLFSYPKKVDKQVIKTVARLRLPYAQTSSDFDFQSTLRNVANGLLQSSKKKAILVAKDIQQCLSQAPQQNSNKGGTNYNYSYTSIAGQGNQPHSGPVAPPLPPIPALPPLPPFPAVPKPNRLYWNYN